MHFAKFLIKKLLRACGYEILRRDSSNTYALSMRGAFDRLKTRNIHFNTVIDIGAAVGSWSNELAAVFPDRYHLLIEANPVHLTALEECQRENAKWAFVLKACGEFSGTIFFDGSNPFGGQAMTEPAGINRLSKIPVTTVDKEVELSKFQGPYLIKLDTHGFEIPILKGAEETLATTEILIVECYNFRIATECLQFWDFCQWLIDRGFRPIDIFDLSHRPLDMSLWQMDIIFVRSSRCEFQSAAYQ